MFKIMSLRKYKSSGLSHSLIISYPLAYLTAKTNGMTEETEAILKNCGLGEDQLKLPQVGKTLQTPRPIVPTFKSNWPVKAAGHSFFEKALLGGVRIWGEEVGENNCDHDDS